MARTQQGFSLVEVLVAILVLSAGALAAATALHHVSQALMAARHTIALAHAASTKVAQFRSLAWHFEESSLGVFTPVEDVQTNLSDQRFAAGGHGVAPGTGLDHVGGSGQWAGGGTSTPDAALARAWRIRPHGSAANLRVMVVDVRRHQTSSGLAGLPLAQFDRRVALRSRGVQ